MSRYFAEDEMRCKCGKCGGKVHVCPELWVLMDAVREAVGHPLVPTSGYRCAQHPVEVAKPTPGEHTYGCAVDFPVVGDKDRFLMVAAAVKGGCRRIGIGPNFIHLGLSHIFPEDVMWTYYK